MAITLITTPGTATSNSYATLASASEFLEQNIHTYSTWSSATTANRNACLVWATRLLDDQMDWNGSKSDPTGIGPENQALRWPRENIYDSDGNEIDEDLIPKFLVRATSEYAIYLLSEDRTSDFDTYGFKKLKVASLSFEVDKQDRRPVMPLSVWAMIKDYGTRSYARTRNLERI